MCMRTDGHAVRGQHPFPASKCSCKRRDLSQFGCSNWLSQEINQRNNFFLTWREQHRFLCQMPSWLLTPFTDPCSRTMFSSESFFCCLHRKSPLHLQLGEHTTPWEWRRLAQGSSKFWGESIKLQGALGDCGALQGRQQALDGTA